MKLRSEESEHWLQVDPQTGLINQIGLNDSAAVAITSINAKLSLESNGSERRAPTGGIEYFDTEVTSQIKATGEPNQVSNRDGSTWKIPVSIGAIPAALIYRFNTHGPAVSISLEFYQSQNTIRNVNLNLSLELDQGDWNVNIPGNGLRGNLPLSRITESIGISPLGGLRGSASLIHLEKNEKTITAWIDNDIEIPESLFIATGNIGAEINIKSNFGSDLSLVKSIEVPLLSIDLTQIPWTKFPMVFDGWLRSRGITSPGVPPKWVAKSMIFEAQIGFSVFAQINKYSPYPTVKDLIEDLTRIKELGFSCIQLMPKQPYPSYNVHDYRDIDTSYGEKKEIKRLVEEAHRLGIRVILDVLLHGVLDQEIIKVAADGVRSGPFRDLIESETEDSFSSDVKDWQNYLIAWSRHILDFEPYWSGGSPEKTKLEDEHPDWFYRDSNGDIAGVYTKAFDARNSEWQDYFTESMAYLVAELDIDGFRFDAPTYNDFYNWAPWARYRASASALACTGLFERMRPVFKELKSDFLFYTEPSGLSLRRSMDLNYNYDEQWLVTSLAAKESQKPWGIHSAKDLAQWMKDRDSLLPHGSMTAHHIDSHDTFWWPTWGKKWRREQFGIEMVRNLTLIFATLPGPFMMFIGGEEGIEDLLPQISDLKSTKTWYDGTPKWWCDEATPPEIFGLSRSLDDDVITVLVNTSGVESSFVPSANFAECSVIFSIGTSCTVGKTVILPPNSGVVVSHRRK